MTGTDIGCGHCGQPLEVCDCGVDYEIAYRPVAHLGVPGISPELRRIVLLTLSLAAVVGVWLLSR